MLTKLPDHRRALSRVRLAMLEAREEPALILHRQRQANRHMLGIARRELEAVRAANRQIVGEHKRNFRAVVEQMKAEAHDYKVIYMEAKREGQRLLQFVDRVFKRAA